MRIEEAAGRAKREALAALAARSPAAAYDRAGRACRLHRSPESVKILAIAALACGKFGEAVALWREISCGPSP